MPKGFADAIDKDHFLKVNGINHAELADILNSEYPLLPGVYLPSDLGLDCKFTFVDSLAIEIARTLGDGLRIPLKHALQLVAYAGAVEGFQQFNEERGDDHFIGDFWFAVMGLRANYIASADSHRGSIPVGAFGPNEFLITAHFTGPMHQIAAEINGRIVRDEASGEAVDPAWTMFANVSAAARRLHARFEGTA